LVEHGCAGLQFFLNCGMTGKNPHERMDRINLVFDRLVAAKIRATPHLVEVAKSNLARWRAQNDGELAPAHLEWELALRFLTPTELADFLESDTPKANRLRQSSPFAGILSESERLAILRSHEGDCW
jgi:hypothetical protein